MLSIQNMIYRYNLYRLQKCHRPCKILCHLEDTGYPTNVGNLIGNIYTNAVNLIGNIYTNATISFSGKNFRTIQPVKIQRNILHGDTLRPYIFLIFL